MKISLIQFEIVADESGEERVNRVMDLIDQCKGSDLIVLPELWHVGLLSYRTVRGFAEDREGPLMRRISSKAKELHAFINCGSYVQKAGDKLYNTTTLFDRNGTDVAEYHKIHLFSCYGHEADTFEHGSKAVVVDTELGKIGLAICYDIRFPELFRKMTLGMGAEFFIVPAAWPYPRAIDFKMMNKVRAMENSAYVLSCNLTGPYKHLTMVGGSAIIDPWGESLAAGEDDPVIINGEFTSEMTRRHRRDFPVFNDVRMPYF